MDEGKKRYVKMIRKFAETNLIENIFETDGADNGEGN